MIYKLKQSAMGGGEQLWNDILKMIEEKIKNKDSITQHYTIKAFVATSTK